MFYADFHLGVFGSFKIHFYIILITIWYRFGVISDHLATFSHLSGIWTYQQIEKVHLHTVPTLPAPETFKNDPSARPQTNRESQPASWTASKPAKSQKHWFHSFYKQNLILSIKMLLKPLVLATFQKKKAVAAAAWCERAPFSSHSNFLFRKCCKTNAFSNMLLVEITFSL